MMGARLEDPKAIERNLPAVPGLGLLPQCTIIEPEKITRQKHLCLSAWAMQGRFL